MCANNLLKRNIEIAERENKYSEKSDYARATRVANAHRLFFDLRFRVTLNARVVLILCIQTRY